jgi:hypothetical protein
MIKRPRPRPGRPIEGPEFDGKMFEKFADDMKSGRLPLPRVTIGDPETKGLSALIRSSGLISFHVQYEIYDEEGSRPKPKIGNYPEMSVKQARALANTIHALAERDIDPFKNIMESRIEELLKQGANWRPAKTPK